MATISLNSALPSGCEAGQALTFELGIGRVHDHHRRLVIDPEILLAGITQPAYDLHRLFLGLFTVKAAGAFQIMEILEDARHALHHMLGFSDLAR